MNTDWQPFILPSFLEAIPTPVNFYKSQSPLLKAQKHGDKYDQHAEGAIWNRTVRKVRLEPGYPAPEKSIDSTQLEHQSHICYLIWD